LKAHDAVTGDLEELPPLKREKPEPAPIEEDMFSDDDEI
jgi:hypothetical protein